MVTERPFLDIGAHRGMSTEAALDYGFTEVHSFEPMPTEFGVLEDCFDADSRVHLYNFGLSDATGPRTVYGTNEGYEASVYRGEAIAADAPSTTCRFVDAADWFACNLPDDAGAIVKMNCEGSEVDILERLMDTGEFRKLGHLLVEFDIRRVEGQAHREGEVRGRMRALGFRNWDLMTTYAYGEHNPIYHWLEDIKAVT